jgi:YVTN family beta-propeller protein
MAYIANYADGTISEVNLSTLAVTRTLAVMTHPASVAFDSSGNLWVGGQGSVDNVNISSWTITSSTAVDGTVNGMSYDAGSGVLLQTILQNGSSIAPSDGATANALVNYSNSSQVSYTTQNTFNTSTGASTISPYFGDNASYNLSSAAYYLAFPAQTAFTPPIYSSSNGDITATVSGTNFIVSVVSSGAILIQGSLPYPARGVALVSNMVYFTMPDTNSLISLPITLP